MVEMMSNILPPNATKLERDLYETIEGRLNELSVPTDTLWSPKNCPVQFLPWLAWQLHIDNWDNNLAESQKRELISKSVKIHKHKGTRGSLEDVLNSFNLGLDIKEWFEYGGNPYYFKIIVDIFERGIDENTLDLVRKLVNGYKNTRSRLEVFSILLTATSKQPYIASTAQVGKIIMAEPYLDSELTSPDGNYYIASGFHKIKIIQAEPL